MQNRSAPYSRATKVLLTLDIDFAAGGATFAVIAFTTHPPLMRALTSFHPGLLAGRRAAVNATQPCPRASP